MSDDFSIRFHDLVASVRPAADAAPARPGPISSTHGQATAAAVAARGPGATRKSDNVSLGAIATSGGAEPPRDVANFFVDRDIEEMNMVRDIFAAAGLK